MKDTVYLVLTQRRVDRMLHAKVPRLKGGEVAVKLTVSVDDSNFKTPLATADLEIAESQIIDRPRADVVVDTPDNEEDTDG